MGDIPDATLRTPVKLGMLQGSSDTALFIIRLRKSVSSKALFAESVWGTGPREDSEG